MHRTISKSIFLGVLYSWSLPALTAGVQISSSDGIYAIEHANLIPMTANTVLADHTLVVRDGRISEICPSADRCAPSDARVISAQGKYLIPALVDSHNHFGGVAFDGRDETRIRTRNQHLRQYVMFGVMTANITYCLRCCSGS